MSAIPKRVRKGIIIQMLGLFSRAQPDRREDLNQMINFTTNRVVAIAKNHIEAMRAMDAVILL